MLAELVRPRGNKGELLAISQTDVPGRLENLGKAWVSLPNGTIREVELEQVWQHQQNWVLKFAGVDSISEAEAFSGLDLWVPSSERAELPAGEYFRSDLLGFSIILASTGEPLGKVTGFEQYGGPMLLAVQANEGKEVLIPFVEAICLKVDLDGQSILVDPPEGLLNL